MSGVVGVQGGLSGSVQNAAEVKSAPTGRTVAVLTAGSHVSKSRLVLVVQVDVLITFGQRSLQAGVVEVTTMKAASGRLLCADGSARLFHCKLALASEL